MIRNIDIDIDIRKMTGFALGLFGTFLAWQSGVALVGYFRGGGVNELAKLILDPEHSLRLLSAMAAYLAGLAALTERQGGAWLAGLSTALLGVQTMALIAGHGAVYNWQNEAIFLTILSGLFLSVVVTTKNENAAPTGGEPLFKTATALNT